MGILLYAGNFATIDNNLQIIDRRAGRIISKDASSVDMQNLERKNQIQ